MIWARGRDRQDTIYMGEVAEGNLYPRSGLADPTPAGDPVPLADLSLLAPVVPGKFIGLWNNFHAAADKNGWARPEHPLYFLKPTTSVTGPDATVTIPDGIGRVLFEGELGLVIGQRCKNIAADEAAQAILGYTCINDLTALTVLGADDSFAQWTRAKGFDGFGPIGPVIVSGLDWRDLTVKVTVNGRERQSYACSDMIFGPEEIVARLSRDMTLEPGDVIACGTSLGAMPVKPGQDVVVSIAGLGDLGVTLVAPT